MISNFGGNIRLRPAVVEKPRSEDDVVELLQRHRGRRVRAIGSKHSWSRILESDDVLLDVSALDSIVIRTDPVTLELEAEVGAGCTLEQLLRALNTDEQATLPAIGGVTKQTIAGAIATGTHGSGQHSISHYVKAMRIARYEGDRVVIRTLAGGPTPGAEADRGTVTADFDALRAARCSLGSLGLVVSVTLECRRQYPVHETVRRYDAIADVLAQRPREPLQYFIWLPFDWRFVCFERHPVTKKPTLRQRAYAAMRRAFYYLFVDHAFHAFVTWCDRWLHRRSLLARLYAIAAGPLLVRRRAKIDRSDRALTMNHDLYRHVEVELAVPAASIERAAELIRHVTEVFAGGPIETSPEVKQVLIDVGLASELAALDGSYTLSYPISFRYVRADDTLMSQSADGAVYTVSLFCYSKDITAFTRYASLLTRCLASAFDARPHFGKIFELDGAEVRRLYGERGARFTEIVRGADPQGVFSNAFVREILGR